jgi:hypothetical protein
MLSKYYTYEDKDKTISRIAEADGEKYATRTSKFYIRIAFSALTDPALNETDILESLR